MAVSFPASAALLNSVSAFFSHPDDPAQLLNSCRQILRRSYPDTPVFRNGQVKFTGTGIRTPMDHHQRGVSNAALRSHKRCLRQKAGQSAHQIIPVIGQITGSAETESDLRKLFPAGSSFREAHLDSSNSLQQVNLYRHVNLYRQVN